MSIPNFHIPHDRVEDLEYYIAVAGERGDELKPVLEDIMDKILAREKRMFESRGATSGVYWSPLKGSTVEDKLRYHAPHPYSPLRGFTGDLMDSLSKRGAKYQTLDVNQHGLHLATRHPAVGYHETGTRDMPRRPPLVIPAKHSHEYIGMLDDFIFGQGAYA